MGTTRSIKLGILLASSALSSIAAAQTTPPTAPPQRYEFDANNVDRVTGHVLLTSTDLTIGPVGNGGLAYTRYYQNGGGPAGWDGTTSNWALILYADPANANSYKVGIGARIEEFLLVGNTFNPVAANGSTLTRTGSGSTAVYTYTNSSGDVVTFDVDLASDYDYNVLRRASKVSYASHLQATLTWIQIDYCAIVPEEGHSCPPAYDKTRVRLQSVASSQGYQLKLGYVVDDIKTPARASDWSRLGSVSAINTSLDYCDPAASGCDTPSQTPAKVSYASAWSGSTLTVDASDPLSHVTRYTLSPTRIGVKRPTANADTLVYTLVGDQVTKVVREGVAWTYAYTPAGSGSAATLKTEVTDALGNKSATVANVATATLKSSTDELGHITTYDHEATTGRLLGVTFPEGNRVTYTYDPRGNVTETRAISKTPGTPPDLVTNATYAPSCGNPVSCNQPLTSTDARRRVTNYAYDPTIGLVRQVTQPAPTTATTAVRPQTRYGYAHAQAFVKNAAGAVVGSGVFVDLVSSISTCLDNAGAPVGDLVTVPACVGTADEARTTIDYGAANVPNTLLPIAVTRAAGDGSVASVTRYGYDSAGNVTSVDGPLGGSNPDVTVYRYNAARQVEGVISPDPDGTDANSPDLPRATRITFDEDGQTALVETGTVTTQSDWASFAQLQRVATTYDPATARRTRDVLSAGSTDYSVFDYSYDALGRPSCTAQRMNPDAWGTPSDACSLQQKGIYGYDRIARQAYDEAGQALALTTALGTPEARAETTPSYHANGTLDELKDANGNRTRYEYDGHDRLMTTRYPNAATGVPSTTDYEQLTYTGVDVTARRLRDGTSIAYGYDLLGRLTSKTRPTGTTNPALTFAYDNLGLMTAANGSAPTALTFAWDALGRLTSETDAAAGGEIGYLYDAAGRMTRQTWVADSIWAGYEYLTTGEVSRVTRNGGSELATYDYDNLGRRTRIARGNGVVTRYLFDGGSRLKILAHDLPGAMNAWRGSYEYNPAGQIVSKGQLRNAYASLALPNGTTPYLNNRLSQVTRVGSGAGTPVGHDARGNVTAIGGSTYGYGADGLLQSGPGGTFLYDGLDRLYRIDAEGVRLRYDLGGAIASEHDAATGAVTARYIHGAGADEPLVRFNGSGVANRRWLLADERGSIVAETDAGGAVTQVDAYDEYGVPGAGNAGRFGYTGQAWVASMGGYYYKARVYQPMLGRFLQPDPIGYAGGMNLYAYVGGDPVNLVDPSGTVDGCPGDGTPNGKGGCYPPIVVNAVLCPFEGCNAGNDFFSSPRAESAFDRANRSLGQFFSYRRLQYALGLSNTPQDKKGPVYLTKIPCFGAGLLLRAGGDALVDVAGAGVALGGTGTAAGTGLGLYGAATGNVPAAGVGALVAAPSALLATGSAIVQGGGALLSFIGGSSLRELVKNGTAAIVDRIPGLPAAVKFAVKNGAKYGSDYIPDVRTCDRGY